MEDMFPQRVTPLLKCVVLFLFIFTAKVLTSRPQDTAEERNSVQYPKPVHYVRTFTKYHHRRTIQYNNDYWPSDYPKVIQKRSIEIPDSNEFLNENVPSDFSSDSLRNNIVPFEKQAISIGNKDDKVSKNRLSNTVQKTYKERVKTTDESTTIKPSISCLYKTMNVANSMGSYDDDKNSQFMVVNEGFDFGPLSETTLPSGERVQVEHCTDPRAYCYTLWQQDGDTNNTVLRQGCWRASQRDHGDCGACRRVMTPRLPPIRFCCCTTSLCNEDYLSLPEAPMTIKAPSVMDDSPPKFSHAAVWGGAAALLLVAVALVTRIACVRARRQREMEKGEATGGGPDTLATGLSCVDNLTLIEHIGVGKFGSVWRGSLGSTPVAVKLYSNANAWQKEAALYAIPHLSHPNLLKYYGSDTRPTLTEGGGRDHLIVLQLCAETLRSRLQRAPLTWQEFAKLAHGIASALAHLHTPTPAKPCIVHRDVNSNNVLIAADGTARLADLGLAQTVLPRKDQAPTRVTEAGTLRYLSPEALEGALDLSACAGALCAVDVFALGLVLWECLWRCAPAHRGTVPPYQPPYHPHQPTLPTMQNLVSRNKLRPPLPKGPVTEARALKIACDTCEECWDHDAEARLTAVCVEERMAELKQLLRAHPPLIHDNNLHPHADTAAPDAHDKNSNCTSACDVTPLLYHPLAGRNTCIERNTHTQTPTTVHLVHKSLKDVTATSATAPVEAQRTSNAEENCLSVARVSHARPVTADFENSDRLNEIRSYQRPLLDYVQNDVSNHDRDGDRRLKDTNLMSVKVEKPKWGLKNFLSKFGKKMETEVILAPDSVSNGVRTTIIEKPCNVTYDRPANLVLQDRGYNFEVPCTLSPPNRTLSPTMMVESEMNRSENKIFGYKELPNSENERPQNQIFAVIVPKAKPADLSNIVEIKSKNKGSSESINKRSVRTSMSSQSIIRSGNSESEDSTVKKRLSCDNKIITNNNSASSSRASINLELQYLDNNQTENFSEDNSPFDLNSDCSSSEDEHLMLLSENGGSKITMQTIPKVVVDDKMKYQNEVLKEATQTKTDFTFNKFQNNYSHFDNEFSDPNDKENAVNGFSGYSGDNPLYLAALNGEIATTDIKLFNQNEAQKSPKPALKNLAIKRQHSLEQVSELFSSSGDVNLQNPAGRVKTPGDLPVAIRRARRARILQKGRASENNRLSLYDDRMMFGNSL